MSPVVMFMGICGAMAGLCIVFGFSVYYYWRAKDIAPYLSQFKALKEQIAIAQETRARETQKISELQNEIALAERAIADSAAAKKYLEENSGRVEALRNEIESYSAKAQKAEELYKERQEELVQRQQELADVSAKLAGEREKSSALEKRMEEQSARLEELKADEGRARALIAKLEQEKSGLSTEVNELQALRQRLGHEVERLRAEHAELLKQNQLAAQQLAATQSKEAELSGQASAAQRILSDLAATRKEDNDKWANLDLAVIGESGRRFASIDQADWLRQFERLLEKHGFVFSGRTLRAFHTGLLCSQVSPLVVLSGISGTGKSLLPELYASALGLNFLPVPVQPRWDSPQDLFGFYNYMEGRYKATELARLLWQFDRYNNDKAKGRNKQSVNLVLLDEMNLARVEYYFSDLLSKLETRNGIDPDNDEQRQRAEIELECNASGAMHLTRRLFVSPHTLFVGTMNEDESTQTLSDKVIDRSNVLRFGRPQELNAHPDKGAFLKACETLPRIDTAAWDGWRRVGRDSAGRLDFLADTLKAVVPALDGVGRPYGYRVDAAMKTYVMNYPGKVADAVADQIEMKILPKLNGLELEHPGFPALKAALDGAIAETGDAALQEAFGRSCPQGGTFFKWQGVAR